jgi:hypothetical protein
MNEPKPLGLFLGKITQYTDKGAYALSDEVISKEEGRSKLVLPVTISISFDSGFMFGIGTHLPKWLEKRIGNGREIPSHQDVLVMETWKGYSSTLGTLYVAARWGYFGQFQES